MLQTNNRKDNLNDLIPGENKLLFAKINSSVFWSQIFPTPGEQILPPISFKAFYFQLAAIFFYKLM
jgi:hypothetical protein